MTEAGFLLGYERCREILFERLRTQALAWKEFLLSRQPGAGHLSGFARRMVGS